MTTLQMIGTSIQSPPRTIDATTQTPLTNAYGATCPRNFCTSGADQRATSSAVGVVY